MLQTCRTRSSRPPVTDLAGLLAVVLLVTLLLPATATALEDPTYRALRDAGPDGRSVTLSEAVTLRRDVFTFSLDSGTIHLVEPVEGRTWAAVFVGSGSWRLDAATEDERDHLGFLLGDDDFEVLRDSFDTLVLLFGDDTGDEIASWGTVSEGTPAPAAVDAWNAHLERQRQDFEINFHLRILQDLHETPTERRSTDGAFLAFVDGADLPPLVAATDPRGAEAVIGNLTGGEDTWVMVEDDTRGGLWYMSHRRDEVEAGIDTPFEPRADALHYTVDTTIEDGTSIRGTTVARFTVERPVRVLTLSLLPTLRLSKASYRLAPDTLGDGTGAATTDEATDAWTEVAFVQEDEEEDPTPAVVLPELLSPGTEVELALEYAGDEVLEDRGGGVFAVQARTSWYPNFGVFTDPATFDLSYRVPAELGVVSVGVPVGTMEGEEDGEAYTVSRWSATEPIRVAGFNYGRFEALEQEDEETGIQVEVHTTPGTPDIIREINAFLRQNSETRGSIQGLDSGPIRTGPSSLGRINVEDLSEAAMADGLNALRIGTVYFGPLPQSRVAITQQEQWSFGQSWPQLIFLPFISFLDGTQRQMLGMGAGATDFVNQVGFHEMAHQWWGHHVGWESYRDQWLSEGFAEFTAALAVQQTAGWEAYRAHWENARRFIGSRAGSSVPQFEVGPITRGWRLSTSRSPAAYGMVYSKGGFVLHMLRMMMWNPSAPNPDGAFIAMMRDFTARYAGEAPSTADFQRVVEAHMTPNMNATGDGSMDWFFDQWVYGTEVPALEADLEADRERGDSYRITGTIEVSGVSDEFKALVPLYVELRSGETVQFGVLPFFGPATRDVDVTVELPERPREVLVNVNHEVLTRP